MQVYGWDPDREFQALLAGKSNFMSFVLLMSWLLFVFMWVPAKSLFSCLYWAVAICVYAGSACPLGICTMFHHWLDLRMWHSSSIISRWLGREHLLCWCVTGVLKRSDLELPWTVLNRSFRLSEDLENPLKGHPSITQSFEKYLIINHPSIWDLVPCKAWWIWVFSFFATHPLWISCWIKCF